MSDADIVLTPATLRRWRLPEPEGDKHARGTVLVVGGAAATPGAVLLAGVAALRAGAGVLQIRCDPAVASAVAVAVPEAKVSAWPRLDGTDEDGVGDVDAILVGPGLDSVEHAHALLRWAAAGAPDAALVADAYALPALATEPELLHGRPVPAVLTPNAGEAAALLDGAATRPADDAAVLARRYQAMTTVAGHIAAPDGRRWREEGGDAGLGTSGSGDVLAGIAAGLLARGADPAQAICWAVHVHAASGQRLAVHFGRTGFLARELADETATTITTLQV
jgi:hydroxyethylthiazole kinase-like uncharacterized protein yjeF